MIEFEWDEAKNQANIAKHGLDFYTASRVFLDPCIAEYDDIGRYGEMRWNAVGMVDGRLLHVAYTEREGVYRIISARGAEPHEKRKYHEI